MLKKTPIFKAESNTRNFHNERFEYLHNYWSNCNTKHNLLFFNEIRYESHRTLLKKITLQLKYNFKHSYPIFNRLFINHTFFKQDNIIAKKKSIQDRYNKVLRIIDSTGTSSNNTKKNNYKNNQGNILKEIKAIENVLIKKEYREQLTQKLLNILCVNKSIDFKFKNDIKFLVNALIVELYHYGYSIKYILKIPDIIICQDILNEFPFEKVRKDFETKAAYERYKEYEKKT